MNSQHTGSRAGSRVGGYSGKRGPPLIPLEVHWEEITRDWPHSLFWQGYQTGRPRNYKRAAEFLKGITRFVLGSSVPRRVTKSTVHGGPEPGMEGDDSAGGSGKAGTHSHVSNRAQKSLGSSFLQEGGWNLKTVREEGLCNLVA